MAGIGLAGTSIGLASMLAAAPLARMAQLPSGRRDLWTLRLFGSRDLVLGVALLATSGKPHKAPARLLLWMTAATQVSDLLVTALALRRGVVSRRAAAAVVLGAPPTLLAVAWVLGTARRRRQPEFVQ